MLEIALENLFTELNSNCINYCILRDFNNLELINCSDDIDLFIEPTDFLKADKILQTLGWFTPRVNPNAYGHVQYYKCESKRLYKLDVLKGMYYSDGKYKLNYRKLGVCYEIQNNMRVPTKDYALLFLLLHIILDKDSISEKSAAQLQQYVVEIENNEKWWYALAKDIIDTHDYDLKYKKIYIEIIEKNECVEKKSNKIWRLKRRILGRLWRMKIKKNLFVVLGVDGTGKSSTIESLKKYYGNDVFVQYMGFRSYRTEIAKKWASDKAPKIRMPGINLLMQQVSCYYEMICRYRWARNSKKKVILFDRYVWEANDNARNSPVKVISWLLFKLIFPRPDHIVYLFCPTEVSLSRKDDIDDVDGFVKMKERIDAIYLKKSSALILDTSVDSIETVIDKVITYICVETQGYVK